MRRVLVAAVPLVMLVGCAANPDATPATETVTVTATAEQGDVPEPGPDSDEEPVEARDPAPDVVGMALNEARDLVREAGYAVDMYDSLKDRAIMMTSNWVVTEQAEDGDTVRLGAEKFADSKEPPEPAVEDTTESGLTKWAARDACEEVGRTNYPYGFKPSWILGNIAERIEGDAWFLKAEVKIKNEYGATLRSTFECTVGGTEKSPEIDSMYVY